MLNLAGCEVEVEAALEALLQEVRVCGYVTHRIVPERVST
jgi:hypothetical protein